MEMVDCVALIRDLRVQLKVRSISSSNLFTCNSLQGSVAADLLHWFRNAITRTIRKKIEHVSEKVQRLLRIWVEMKFFKQFLLQQK